MLLQGSLSSNLRTIITRYKTGWFYIIKWDNYFRKGERIWGSFLEIDFLKFMPSGCTESGNTYLVLYVMSNWSFLLPERHDLAYCLLSVLIDFWSEGTHFYAKKKNKIIKKGTIVNTPHNETKLRNVFVASFNYGYFFIRSVFSFQIGETQIYSEITLLNYAYSGFFSW
jgi:hypothetical protein